MYHHTAIIPSQVNIEEVVNPSIRSALARQWLELENPAPPHDRPIAIVGSGPSVKEQIEELKNFSGDIWTVNFVYNLLIPLGVPVQATVMCDYRELMAELVEPVSGIEYYTASTCHPALLDKLAPYEPKLFHLPIRECSELQGKLVIPGGTTCATRAIFLAWALGYREFHIYGCDSGYKDDLLHLEGYAGQGRNEADYETKYILLPSGRYKTDEGMILQVNDFIDIDTSYDMNITTHDNNFLSAAREYCKVQRNGTNILNAS